MRQGRIDVGKRRRSERRCEAESRWLGGVARGCTRHLDEVAEDRGVNVWREQTRLQRRHETLDDLSQILEVGRLRDEQLVQNVDERALRLGDLLVPPRAGHLPLRLELLLCCVVLRRGVGGCDRVSCGCSRARLLWRAKA